MIIVYTSPGCASCRKVKQWLKDRDLPFVEKNIFRVLLNDEEIKHLLMRSENGTDDIVSKRSKIVQESHIDLDAMTTDELIEFIKNNQVGFDSEEIGVFVPEELRRIAENSCNEDCPNFPGCKEVRTSSTHQA